MKIHMRFWYERRREFQIEKTGVVRLDNWYTLAGGWQRQPVQRPSAVIHIFCQLPVMSRCWPYYVASLL
jgi:hypothetical protein